MNSDTENAAAAMQRLRRLFPGTVDIPVSAFPIIGLQSFGKTRLLSAVGQQYLGAPKADIGTRCPVVYSFSESSRPATFGGEQVDQMAETTTLADTVQSHHDSIMRSGSYFSMDPYFARVLGPGLNTMELVDLPGLPPVGEAPANGWSAATKDTDKDGNGSSQSQYEVTTMWAHQLRKRGSTPIVLLNTPSNCDLQKFRSDLARVTGAVGNKQYLKDALFVVSRIDMIEEPTAELFDDVIDALTEQLNCPKDDIAKHTVFISLCPEAYIKGSQTVVVDQSYFATLQDRENECLPHFLRRAYPNGGKPPPHIKFGLVHVKEFIQGRLRLDFERHEDKYKEATLTCLKLCAAEATQFSDKSRESVHRTSALDYVGCLVRTIEAVGAKDRIAVLKAAEGVVKITETQADGLMRLGTYRFEEELQVVWKQMMAMFPDTCTATKGASSISADETSSESSQSPHSVRSDQGSPRKMPGARTPLDELFSPDVRRQQKRFPFRMDEQLGCGAGVMRMLQVFALSHMATGHIGTKFPVDAIKTYGCGVGGAGQYHGSPFSVRLALANMINELRPTPRQIEMVIQYIAALSFIHVDPVVTHFRQSYPQLLEGAPILREFIETEVILRYRKWFMDRAAGSIASAKAKLFGRFETVCTNTALLLANLLSAAELLSKSPLDATETRMVNGAVVTDKIILPSVNWRKFCRGVHDKSFADRNWCGLKRFLPRHEHFAEDFALQIDFRLRNLESTEVDHYHKRLETAAIKLARIESGLLTIDVYSIIMSDVCNGVLRQRDFANNAGQSIIDDIFYRPFLHQTLLHIESYSQRLHAVVQKLTQMWEIWEQFNKAASPANVIPQATASPLCSKWITALTRDMDTFDGLEKKHPKTREEAAEKAWELLALRRAETLQQARLIKELKETLILQKKQQQLPQHS